MSFSQLTTPIEDLSQSRSEEHTSELQSRQYLVCRLLLEKKIGTTTCSTSSPELRNRALFTFAAQISRRAPAPSLPSLLPPPCSSLRLSPMSRLPGSHILV